MALSVVSTPPPIVRGANRCVEYVFNMDDIGDGSTVERRFFYQVYCNDVKIGREKIYIPAETGDFPIKVDLEVETCLAVNFPDTTLSVGVAESYDKMQFELKIEYWEVAINQGNCDPVVEGGRQFTSNITVLNSATQWWEESAISSPLLSAPLVVCLDDEADYFVSLFGVSTYDVFEIQSNGTTTQTIDSDLGAAGMIQGINVGPAKMYPNGSWPDGVLAYQVNFDGRSLKVYRKCSNARPSNLLFLGHQGSWQGITMCELDAINFTTEFDKICEHLTCNTPESLSRRLFPGSRVNNKTASEAMTFTIEVPNDRSQQRWINNLVSSKYHLLQDRNEFGVLTYVRFEVQAGSVQTMKKYDCIFAAITGKIVQDYNLPY